MSNKDYKYLKGFRSGLEGTINAQLQAWNIDGEYEKHKIEYAQPEKLRKYTPDFWLKGPKGTIIIESKGRFVVADRQKHLWIKDQHQELDIRFVFTNSRQKISKGSKTSYADWCDKNGFKYADKLIPLEWAQEIGLK